MKITNLILTSKRNTDLYCTEVLPDKPNGALCVFVHGFCADRTEGGRFVEVAKLLAEHGVSSIMMGQSGCDESKEPFEDYCLKNSFADIRTCIDYMFDHYFIDEEQLFMVGYSMGGRLTSLYVTKEDPRFQTIALWAAAINDEEELKVFLYDENGRSLKKEAMDKGYADYLNAFDGRILHLSREFYEGLELSPVSAMKEYQGNVIIVHGEADDTVLPYTAVRTYENLTTQKDKELVMIPCANHGFGLWNNRMGQSDILVGKTAEFFLNHLKMQENA